MAYEQREGQGSLFKNDRREKDSQPNATGTALIGGIKYRVSAWTKDGAKGKWQSLSFTPMEEGQTKRDDFGRAPASSASLSAHIDDEIPFMMEWR